MEIIKDKKYIVRSVEAGVFYGNIEEKNGNEVTMTDARCLWYWDGAASLNQLAEEGAKNPRDCKFTMSVAELTILNVCEILPCSDKAVANIDAVPVWKR
jgi:hypothetical protein